MTFGVLPMTVTGEKSFTGSYGSFEIAETMPCELIVATTNGCPMLSVRRAAVSRARMSVVPPGGYGTTIRTGLLGYWASAGAAAAASSAKPSAADRRARIFMAVPLQRISFHAAQPVA